jgi:hypothetical protein
MKRFDISAIYVMRISVAIFFLTLGPGVGFSAASPDPELRTNALWVPWLQLALGFFALSSRTTALTGAGFCLISGCRGGIRNLPFDRLHDLFGNRLFSLVSGIPSCGWRNLDSSLYASTGLTLTWGASKFAYPFWTYDIFGPQAC